MVQDSIRSRIPAEFYILQEGEGLTYSHLLRQVYVNDCLEVDRFYAVEPRLRGIPFRLGLVGGFNVNVWVKPEDLERIQNWQPRRISRNLLIAIAVLSGILVGFLCAIIEHHCAVTYGRPSKATSAAIAGNGITWLIWLSILGPTSRNRNRTS